MCFHWRIYIALKTNSPAVIVAVEASSLPAIRGAKKDLEPFIKTRPQGDLPVWLTWQLTGKAHSQGSSFFFFNWRIITLQYCVAFCRTSTWIGVHVSPVTLPPASHPTPPHPTPRLSQHRAGRPVSQSEFPLPSVSRVAIHTCHCHSLSSSHSLLPHCVHKAVPCVWVSVAAL